MKIQYLGTAAAEGIPGIFCTCERCVRSRRIGGRALRTRSQAIIDDKLLIDFPADTYAHILNNNIDLANVYHCLITHSHQDHLYPKDIRMLEPGYATMPKDYHLTFYGTEKVGEQIRPMIAYKLEEKNISAFREVEPFVCFEAGEHKVTALPAVHDQSAGPVFYQISDGDKNMLYAHDTYYFHDSVWSFWEKEKPYFSLVSLDCTNACRPITTYKGHMGLHENIQVRDRMVEEGYADDKTVFVCNHFSHNGIKVVYDDFVPIAIREGFVTSYDGMVISV